MKISLLLEREPFPAVFEETMERYLLAITGRAHSVRWRDRSLGERLVGGVKQGEWLCNPLVNAIFSSAARREVFHLPWRWYGRGPSMAKTAAQRFYLLAATAPHSRKRLAPYSISITPDIDHADRVLIAGGNTRLRLFDFKQGEAITILKARFNEMAISADLALRAAHPWLPAPPILRVLDGGRAYVEPILRGGTAAEVKDTVPRDRAYSLAVEACARLAEETCRTVSFHSYLAEIISDCRGIVERIGASDHRSSERSIGRIAWIEQQARIMDTDFDIEIGQSHGDMAPGNIMLEGDGIMLVDWERTGMRMLGFDAMTLALFPRRWPVGFIKRARHLAEDKRGLTEVEQAGRAALCGNGAQGEKEARLMLYLAEELRFHLEENLSGPISTPTMGLDLLLTELEKEATYFG